MGKNQRFPYLPETGLGGFVLVKTCTLTESWILAASGKMGREGLYQERSVFDVSDLRMQSVQEMRRRDQEWGLRGVRQAVGRVHVPVDKIGIFQPDHPFESGRRRAENL